MRQGLGQALSALNPYRMVRDPKHHGMPGKEAGSCSAAIFCTRR